MGLDDHKYKIQNADERRCTEGTHLQRTSQITWPNDVVVEMKSWKKERRKMFWKESDLGVIVRVRTTNPRSGRVCAGVRAIPRGSLDQMREIDRAGQGMVAAARHSHLCFFLSDTRETRRVVGGGGWC